MEETIQSFQMDGLVINGLLSNDYYHIVHWHGRRYFGNGSESTSHISAVWSQFKNLITILCTALRPNNLIYFIKEIELCYILISKSHEEKIIVIKDIFDYCFNTCQFNFYDKEFLKDIDKDNYNEDIESDEFDD